MNGMVFKFGPDDSLNWSSEDINLAIKNKEYNKKINNETMLMYAVKINDIDLVKKLIDLNADMSIGDCSNRTPLWLCTIYNRPEIAEILINSGASMEEVPGTNTPLYNALKHDNNEVAKMLINLGANVNVPNRDGKIAIDCASFRNNYEMIDYIKNASIHREQYLMSLKEVNNRITNKAFIDRKITIGQLEKSLINAIEEVKYLKIDRIMKDGFSPNFKINGKDILFYIKDKKETEGKKIIEKLLKYGFDKKKHNDKMVSEIENNFNISLDNDKEIIIKNELIRIYKSIYKDDIDLFSKLDIPKNYCLYNIDIPAFCAYYNRMNFIDYMKSKEIRFNTNYKTIICDDIFLKDIMNEVNQEEFSYGKTYDHGDFIDLSVFYNVNDKESKNKMNTKESSNKEKKNNNKWVIWIILFIALGCIIFYNFSRNESKNLFNYGEEFIIRIDNDGNYIKTLGENDNVIAKHYDNYTDVYRNDVLIGKIEYYADEINKIDKYYNYKDDRYIYQGKKVYKLENKLQSVTYYNHKDYPMYVEYYDDGKILRTESLQNKTKILYFYNKNNSYDSTIDKNQILQVVLKNDYLYESCVYNLENNKVRGDKFTCKYYNIDKSYRYTEETLLNSYGNKSQVTVYRNDKDNIYNVATYEQNNNKYYYNLEVYKNEKGDNLENVTWEYDFFDLVQYGSKNEYNFNEKYNWLPSTYLKSSETEQNFYNEYGIQTSFILNHTNESEPYIIQCETKYEKNDIFPYRNFCSKYRINGDEKELMFEYINDIFFDEFGYEFALGVNLHKDENDQWKYSKMYAYDWFTGNEISLEELKQRRENGYKSRESELD